MSLDDGERDWRSLLPAFRALDLETHLMEQGILAPKIVCGSGARFDLDGQVVGHFVDDWEGALAEARELLEDPDLVLVGANIAYDLGCLVAVDPTLLPVVFRAYGDARVYDALIAQALDAISRGELYVEPGTRQPMRGRYSLDACVRQTLGRDDAKDHDYWRKRYALLDPVPRAEWPEEARLYPVDDAKNTLELAGAQVAGGGLGGAPGPHRNLGDLPAQVETAFDLHLGAIWGFRTDRGRTARLRARSEEAHRKFIEKFHALGLVKPRDKASKKKQKGELAIDRQAVKRAVVRAYATGPTEVGPCARCIGGKLLSPKSGKPVNCDACDGTGLDIDSSGAPRTDGGGVSADRDALLESGDEDLMALGDNEAEKILDTYLPFLESGVDRPISLRPNVLVASGRTSYDGLIQLLPREGGVRECIVARPGYVFCSVDYAALELCTLAQVCLWVLGRSTMADTINATGDPGMLHTALAAQLAGCTTEEMVGRLKNSDKAVALMAKRYRHAAKAGNFGFPGGMGAYKFVLSKRKKNEGSTEAPDGLRYPGIRFCLLLGGAERCGVEKFSQPDRNGNPMPPICRACFEQVNDVLRPAWFRQWDDIGPTSKPGTYFAWVQDRIGEWGDGELPCFGTHRVRGGLDFTNGSNNGFQALAADGAKNALRKLVRECYLDECSPLWGTRPIFFVHDEIVAEIPEERAALAGPRMAEVMVAAMREYVEDVIVKAEPALMHHWVKIAEPAYVGSDGSLNEKGKPWDKPAPGRVLVPWDDYHEYAY
jgi:DNA polymerase-1